MWTAAPKARLLFIFYSIPLSSVTAGSGRMNPRWRCGGWMDVGLSPHLTPKALTMFINGNPRRKIERGSTR